MIFVDSNVFIYAVGRPHPLRSAAQDFFLETREAGRPLIISAEVLQELLYVYLPVERKETLDAALALATQVADQVLPITLDTVLHARVLADSYRALTARDLIHLASCQLHGIDEIKTFDKQLLQAFGSSAKRR